MSANSSTALSSRSNTSLTQLLILSLNGVSARATYAIDITQIREIVRTPALTRIPASPGELAGVTSLRGALVEVFDLPAIVQGSRCNPETGVLVISDAHDGVRGFLVDEVQSILRVPSSEIQAAAQFKSFDCPLLNGFLLQDDGRVLSVLDLARYTPARAPEAEICDAEPAFELIAC